MHEGEDFSRASEVRRGHGAAAPLPDVALKVDNSFSVAASFYPSLPFYVALVAEMLHVFNPCKVLQR